MVPDYRLYGDALLLLETQALLQCAIIVGPEDKDLATLKFCLNCPRDGARKLRWALEIAVVRTRDYASLLLFLPRLVEPNLDVLRSKPNSVSQRLMRGHRRQWPLYR
jgi:hypothetical protein